MQTVGLPETRIKRNGVTWQICIHGIGVVLIGYAVDIPCLVRRGAQMDGL